MRSVAVLFLAAAITMPFTTGCANRGSHGHAHDHAGHHGYHEHSFDRMPVGVQAAVRREYPDAQVVSAGSEFSDKDELAHYHVKLRTATGQTVSAEYDQSGKRLMD